jgi:hypothetical protein
LHRKNVFDVYLEKISKSEIGWSANDEQVVVVLRDGRKGRCIYDGSIGLNIMEDPVVFNPLTYSIQEAYLNAFEKEEEKTQSDYEKYLKTTLGTTRPDPDLISVIEKSYIPRLRGQPKTDPKYPPPKGPKI